ncbi:MAG TPA: response regulator, partial [Hyphomicrobiaceae bacterium]|nr:response regulator [Hyphomicrobiaceae bacterium]
ASRAATIDLQGLRVLVVEDESMVSMLMEDMLQDLGCTVVGTVARFDDALKRATNGPAFDVALLDVNLNGKQTFPIAEALAVRGMRFIFATGYGESILPQSLQGGPILQKPFELEALKRALRGAIAQ